MNLTDTKFTADEYLTLFSKLFIILWPTKIKTTKACVSKLLYLYVEAPRKPQKPGFLNPFVDVVVVVVF